ncbi:MAG: succinate dehydrogenase iron-sulfur subunit [Candidatus Calescibacterium sp.]|nr:succinate dehydrogenase iron-sulfur subunit [Candidatus Calescibacterium sp.]MCX7972320.1 succinate dehydrogenase iron-sulfur subunit [bacterium]MDW8195076.1 succinate dehydrogenase iron-sulfur subunit [Candidatus Calescibacterium sp.]
MRKVRCRIKRQDSPTSRPYWQEFEVDYEENMNVIILLMRIRERPVDINGKVVKPIMWEASCLEQVCGSCTMVINGVPQQACSALVDKLAQPIIIEPLSKFPVVRDLVVNRKKMFETLKKIRAWIDIEGTHDLGPGPKYSPQLQQVRYLLSRCMTCGACLEACPQYGDGFIGPFAIAQAHLFNLHPTGAFYKDERLKYMAGREGISNCSNAQLCVQVCPKEIPLTEAIAEVNAEVTRYLIKLITGSK